MKLSWSEAFRLALPPALLALGVTLLRLAGELGGWSERWFSRATGGIIPPSALGWIVGITWLALPFGAYFAWRLAGREERPTAPRAILLSVAAVLVLYLGAHLVQALLRPGPAFLLLIWSSAVAGAAIAWRAWPALARTLVAYGLLSRLPVAIVMFLAMRGHWGTHYDYADAPAIARMPFATAYVFLAFIPQLVFWVAFTVVAGILAAGITLALRRPRLSAAALPLLAAFGLASPLGAEELKPSLEALQAEVRAREQAFAKTMADRDLAAFSRFVSEEAVFAGGQTTLRGRRAVVEGWKARFEGQKAPFSWAPERVEAVASGTLALSSGPVFDPDGKRIGTFHSTWRKEKDGQWRVVLDIGCPPCQCP